MGAAAVGGVEAEAVGGEAEAVEVGPEVIGGGAENVNGAKAVVKLEGSMQEWC